MLQKQIISGIIVKKDSTKTTLTGANQKTNECCICFNVLIKLGANFTKPKTCPTEMEREKKGGLEDALNDISCRDWFGPTCISYSLMSIHHLLLFTVSFSV